MKIVFPTTEFPPMPGGVATLAYEQAVGLARAGNEVFVETIEPGAAGVQPLAQDQGELPANLHVSRRAVRARAILRLLPLGRQLGAAIRQMKPDFICCPTYRGFGLPVMANASASRVPYSIYIHGTELRTETRRLLRKAIMGNVLQRAAFVATNSENTKRLVHAAFPLLKTRVVAITPGVHPERFGTPEACERGAALRAEWLERMRGGGRNDEGVLVLVSLCRMVREKGIEVVLCALAKVRRQRPDLRFAYIAVGEGADLDEFRHLSAELELVDHVHFPGGVPLERASAVLAAADVYVQPSQPLGDFLESFGISFLEAQATGLPCIGSDWGGVPEAVIRNKTALLVPTGDTDAVARAIVELADSGDRRAAMSAHGRAWSIEHTWNEHAQRLRNEIAKAIALH